MVHMKCRNNFYPFSKVGRIPVLEVQVPWSFPWRTYDPPEYNSPVISNKPWADPPIGPNFTPNWNALDGNVNRISHSKPYNICEKGRPLNPEGRTGLRGRGVLGRWGPNHAADPIVSRWKRTNGIKQLQETTKLPILEVCMIKRKDCNEWALPGGMVDPGEQVSLTLKREFLEEALNHLERDIGQKSIDKSMVEGFFKNGEEIYKGYVDDHRNTDNAWMETVAMNFHDEEGSSVGKLGLEAGDDAKSVQWLAVSAELTLYASHSDLVKKVAQRRQAHW